MPSGTYIPYWATLDVTVCFLSFSPVATYYIPQKETNWDANASYRAGGEHHVSYLFFLPPLRSHDF